MKNLILFCFACAAACAVAAENPGKAVSSTGVISMKGHPVNGMEPLDEPPVIMEYDAAAFDSLAGLCYRGNLERNGVYQAAGPQHGKLLWKTALGKSLVGSPVAVGDAVYTGTHEGLVALDAGTGAVKWKHPVAGGVHSTPCIVQGKAYFGGNDGALHAVNIADGSKVWTALGNGKITASPGLVYGRVFIDRGIGFDAATGEKIWTTAKQKNLSGATDGRLASVAFTPDAMVLAGFTGNALGFKYGKFIFGGDSHWEGENTIAISGGKLFVVESGAGGNVKLLTLTCKDARTGSQLWAAELLPVELSKTRFVAFCSPGAWEGVVVAGSDAGAMYGFDAEKGDRLWSFKTGGGLRSAPSFSAQDGGVFFGSNDGNFYALDAKTGSKRWVFGVGAAVQTSPCISAGRVYFGADDGCLYAVE